MSSNIQSNAASGSGTTHVRWHILALLGLIAALSYLDRLNLSISGKQIQDEFAFSTEAMGWILSSFVLGYALFQVPGGWLGDRFGARGVLTAAILFWSVMTTATALAPRLPLVQWLGVAWSFALIRFLVGVGEAMAFPNVSRMTAFWMSPQERGLASSLWLVGIGVGGIVTPLLVARTSEVWGWRASFHVCAAIGVVIALIWRFYVTNHPEDHPRVSAEELALIRAESDHVTPVSRPGSTPWRKIVSSFSAWGLILSYFCIVYPAYIFYTWFFIYLVRVRGLSVEQGSLWGSAPFIAIAFLAPFGGWVSDRAVALFGKRRGRQAAVIMGATTSAVLMWTGGHSASNVAAILLLAGAAGFNLFATATWWAASNDMTRRHAGALSGLMNMSGNLGGWLSPIVTAYIATRLGWEHALDFAALVTLSSGVFWIAIDAGRDLDPT